MRDDYRDEQRFAMVIIVLLLLGLAGCSMLKPQPTIVMPEARAVYLKAGSPTPWDGWLISASGLSKLIEAAERCQK